MTQPILRVISLGAGVQSTTLALMAAREEIGPMPDCAIFADTGWEPRAVYEHLDWLCSGNVLPFPVHRVSRGSLRQAIIDRRNSQGGRFAAVPWFIKTKIPSGTRVPILGDDDQVLGYRTLVHDEWKDGIGRRQCTSEYKLTPIMWKLRDLLDVGRRGRIRAGAVEVWIGISTDEAVRMKPARQRWQTARWPLIEKRMSRRDCEVWLRRNEFPIPPKSSCIGCPFHSDAMWRDLRDNHPDEWADAVKIDKALRQGDTRGFVGAEFMHSQRVPLDVVDLSTADERGQPDLFGNECEGMCGL
jgi:hypothetical protein